MAVERAANPSQEGYEHSLGGLAAGFVALMAFMGGGISLGLGLWLARFLGQPVSADAMGGAQTPIVLSPIYFVGSLANVVLLVAVVLTAVTVFIHTHRNATQFQESVAKQFRDEIANAPEVLGDTGIRQFLPNSPVGSSEAYLRTLRSKRIHTIASAWAWAKVADCAPRIVAWLVGFTIIDLVASYVAYSWWRPAPKGLDTAVTASGALTALLGAGFIGLAYKAFRQRETRRGVGILWDVMTFWPQASHPFGPPCYGQRAVPDLRDRVEQLTRYASTSVVLAAHSQGTIIAAAALLLRPSTATGPEVRDDAAIRAGSGTLLSKPVALLSFGSPLRRLYARNFPAYFGFEILASIKTAAPERWINLWVHTDPIGGWIFNHAETDCATDDTKIDSWLRDAAGLIPGDGSYPPICHHSGFWSRDEYTGSVNALAMRTPPPTAAPGLGEAAGLRLYGGPLIDVAVEVPVPLRLPSAAE